MAFLEFTGRVPEPQESRIFNAMVVILVEHGVTRRVPGLGHPLHKPVDPRTVRLFEIARETGHYGKYCRLMEQIAAEKRLPLNATGAIGALACELGLEEARQPMAEEIWHRVDEEASAHLKPAR